MHRRYDNYLVKKFPKLFRDRYAPMNQTCMCWGFDCGSGWFNIILNLCHLIQNHIDSSRESRANALRHNRAVTLWVDKGDDKGLRHYFTISRSGLMESGFARAKSNPQLREVPGAVSQVVVDQVKEKFGTLRFYFHGGDEYIDGVVRMAEEMTANTCEVCGNKGKLNRSGWIKCRCKDHENN